MAKFVKEHASSNAFNRKTYFYSFFLFLAFCILNFCQPLIVDDLCRGAVAALYHQSIFFNLIHDYFNWTGRMSAQVLVYSFFNAPWEAIQIPIFNVLNALVLVFFYDLCYKIIFKKQYHVNFYLLFVFLLTVFLYYSQFLANAIWKTVALQYFWGIVLLLWFFQREYLAISSKNRSIFSLCLGIFIGLYNEIFFVFVFISYCSALVYHQWIQKLHPSFLSKNIKLFNLGNWIGGIVLLAAPGNYVRAGVIGMDKLGLMDKMIILLKNIKNSNDLRDFVVLGLLFVVFKLVQMIRNQENKLFLKTLFYLFFLMGSIWIYFWL